MVAPSRDDMIATTASAVAAKPLSRDASQEAIEPRGKVKEERITYIFSCHGSKTSKWLLYHYR